MKRLSRDPIYNRGGLIFNYCPYQNSPLSVSVQICCGEEGSHEVNMESLNESFSLSIELYVPTVLWIEAALNTQNHRIKGIVHMKVCHVLLRSYLENYVVVC